MSLNKLYDPALVRVCETTGKVCYEKCPQGQCSTSISQNSENVPSTPVADAPTSPTESTPTGE